MIQRQEPQRIPTTALRPNQGTPNICPVRFQNHYGPVTPLCVPCPPNTPLEKLRHLEITRDFRVTETKRGQVRKVPWYYAILGQSLQNAYPLLNHPFFWLLFADLLVTRVFVRKLKQSGEDFPPPHFTHLVPSVAVNFLSLPLLYTKQLPSL